MSSGQSREVPKGKPVSQKWSVVDPVTLDIYEAQDERRVAMLRAAIDKRNRKSGFKKHKTKDSDVLPPGTAVTWKAQVHGVPSGGPRTGSRFAHWVLDQFLKSKKHGRR